MENQCSYYAVIPATVRHDRELNPRAILLYGEITALCHSKGYCWATNSYFADLYSVSKEAVSRWISSLNKKGYVKIQTIYAENTKEIKERRIYINDCPIVNSDNTPIDENSNTPIDEKVYDNNTVSFNNTYFENNNSTFSEENVQECSEKYHSFEQEQALLLVKKFTENLHPKYNRKEHPFIKREQFINACNNIACFMSEFDIEPEKIELMMIDFLGIKENSDGNINLFANYNVMKYHAVKLEYLGGDDVYNPYNPI